MSNPFYAYALAQALSETGEDYIDTFVPFLLAAMPDEDRSYSLRDIQALVSERFSLVIPEAVLDTIATRAKRRGYVRQEAKLLRTTEEGRSYRARLEPEADVSRRITALLDDISAFFASRSHALSPDEAEGLLLDFLRANAEPLLEFMGGEKAHLPDAGSAEAQHERLLVEYIRMADAGKPEQFDTLRQMVLGSLLTAVLQSSREADELIDLRRRKLRGPTVYLDTNFLFSVLGLHPDDFAKPARELFTLLGTSGIKPKVFSFTVDEACRVLGGYLTHAHEYPTSVRVDTLYSALRTRGWTKFRVQEYIAHIEETLEGLGIELEIVPIGLKSYGAPALDRSLLSRYKPEQPEVSQNHDLAAIAEIRRIRGRSVRRFEDSRAFFLTSDIRLSRYCHRELGHAEHGTIAEVILDKLLTNVLWLKDPAVEAPLRMLVAAYSRDLFVKRAVWDRFYRVLKDLRRDGKVTDDRIAGLLYRSYVEDVLLDINEGETEQITEDFVLQHIERAAKQRDEAELVKLRNQEREFLERLSKATDSAKQARDRAWVERLEGIRKSIAHAAERRARNVATMAATLGSVIALAMAGSVFALARARDWIEPVEFFLPIVLGGGGILGLWRRLHGVVRERYSRRHYRSRIREIGLELSQEETRSQPQVSEA